MSDIDRLTINTIRTLAMDAVQAALRLAALMELPVIYIFTHDSIGVGEDGPTHQPIEQLASLRAIPGLVTLRPADANELREAGARIGMAIFGASAPLQELQRRFGFTVEHVVAAAYAQLGRRAPSSVHAS